MKPVIFDNIPFNVNEDSIEYALKTKVGKSSAEAFGKLLEVAQGIAKPKTLYKMAYIDAKGEDSVEIEGHIFQSRILRVHLEDVHRVFLYVATCGEELYAWKNAMDDQLDHFYADVINGMALDVAREYLIAHIEEQYQLAKTSAMAPGSLEDWPIQAQRPLFNLLGETEKTIGVRLTDSLLMVPNQTVSGIRFPSEHDFKSCQLCSRERCQGRSAPYNEDLYAMRFS